MWQSLAACALPIFVWAIIVLLNEIPALLLRFSAWEMIGVAAYILAIALLESVTVWLVLVLLAAILPARLLRSKFVALTTAIVFVSSAWGIVANYNGLDLSTWTLGESLVMFGLYVLTIALPYGLVQRSRRVESWTAAAARALSILSFVYLLLGCLGFVIVVIRNV